MTSQRALPPLPFNPTRLRSYILRLPLFTRVTLLIIFAFWLLELQTVWSVVNWGALVPNEIGIGGSRSSLDPFQRCSRVPKWHFWDWMLRQMFSVQVKHLPSNTCEFSSCYSEHPGSDAPDRTIWGRIWYSDSSRLVSWTYVLYLSIWIKDASPIYSKSGEHSECADMFDGPFQLFRHFPLELTL
jgi:hypothetical protein